MQVNAYTRRVHAARAAHPTSMSSASVIAVAATSAAWHSLQPLLLLLALIALTIAAVFAMRRYRGEPRDQPMPQSGPELRDDPLGLVLWASGDYYWEYDLVQRRLHYRYAQESAAMPSGLSLSSREATLPVIHPQDLPAVMKLLHQHLEGQSPWLLSEHRMDLDNRDHWVWMRVRGRTVERNAKGQPTRIAGTARNITTERETEHDHRIASQVMHNMNEAVAVVDASDRLVLVNPAFTRITGYTHQEIVGQPAGRLDSGQHSEAFFQRMRAELHRDGHWSGESWKVRKDGEEILCKIEANAVFDSSGQRKLYVQVLSDITEQKRAEQELRYLANYDTLTSLPNRTLLSERLSRAIVRARREQGKVAVLFLDLDHFKGINDSLGHATGDRILRAAAARVQQTVGAQHTVARLSGDEFTVVLEDIASAHDAQSVARQLIEAFNEPLHLGEQLELPVSPSIGISLYPDHALVPTELLKHADTAMYQAKAAGRHTFQLYSESMDEKTRHRAILTNALRRAIERNELSLVFQPKLSVARQVITGAEALLRWENPEFGTVSPAQFIPLAEESGLILDIGAWALREACMTLHGWQAAGLGHMSISVNVSSLQLQRGDLPGLVRQALRESGIPPHQLELELTESVIMDNPDQSVGILHECRQIGVSLAIDDFGTGYSSLAYLKRLPLTTLKIDQEFINDLTRDVDDEAITSTIIAMAHSLELSVVAEGVETAGQFVFLRDHGCDEVQGHYVSRALDANQCLQFIFEHYPDSANLPDGKDLSSSAIP